MKPPQQGAATSVLAAASPYLDTVTGRYLEDCGEAKVVPAITDGVHGVRSYALDPDEAERLWDPSLDLIAVHARQ